MPRDDFSDKVKNTISRRANLMCSNPDCRSPTSGPHTDPQKATSCGIAAHICAAASGGPRYDPNQSPEERKDIENAIWLCHNCSDLVDKDPSQYTRGLLVQWKREHEEFVSGRKNVPPPPCIEVKTVDGIILPEWPRSVVVTGDDCELYRNHKLTYTNTSDSLLQNIHSRLQFPESIIGHPMAKQPAGISVTCKPEIMELFIQAEGGGSVTKSSTPILLASNYNVEIDKLYPRAVVEITLTSCIKRRTHSTDDTEQLEKNNAGIMLSFFVKGSFQSEYRGRYHTENFMVRLIYDNKKRFISSVLAANNTPHSITYTDDF